MAREIDMTKRLSEKDREYLLARGREDLVRRNDAEHSNDPEVLEAALYIPGTAIDLAPGVPRTPNADDAVVQGGGASDPEGDEGFDTSDGDEEGADYEAMTVEQLQEEIDRRNSTYDTEFQLARSGKKKELVARLRDDDQDNEGDE